MNRSDSRASLAGSAARCVAVFIAVVGTAAAQPPVRHAAAELEARFAPVELLFCFQGKGSCLPYDAGVVREAWARLPSLRAGRVIVAGNSSGAIPAAYFGCHGWSDATVRHCQDRLMHGNRDAVRNMEDVNTKIARLSRGQGRSSQRAAGWSRKAPSRPFPCGTATTGLRCGRPG